MVAARDHPPLTVRLRDLSRRIPREDRRGSCDVSDADAAHRRRAHQCRLAGTRSDRTPNPLSTRSGPADAAHRRAARLGAPARRGVRLPAGGLIARLRPGRRRARAPFAGRPTRPRRRGSGSR
jgi:hypothetical protein